MMKEFEMTDLRLMKLFLGIEVEKSQKGIFICIAVEKSQKGIAESITT